MIIKYHRADEEKRKDGRYGRKKMSGGGRECG